MARSWAVLGLRPSGRAFIAATDLAALGVLGAQLAATTVHAPEVARFGLLVALYCCYSVISLRIERTARFLLAGSVWANQKSVWVAAGLVLLPPGLVGLLVVVLFTPSLIRSRRDASGHPYRVVLSAAASVLGACLGAQLLHSVERAVPGRTGAEIGLVLGAGLFTVLSLALLTTARWLLARPVALAGLLPPRPALYDELSAITLGAVVGLVIVQAPWLSPLSLLLVAGLQRGALARHLHVAAATDAKTGLLVMPAWRHEAGRAVRQAQRTRQSVAVLMIDLDFFKRINDTHGHLVGDQVLKVVGQQLERQLRESDRLGRFGGEEFVALLTPAGDPVEVADRLRSSLRALRIPATSGTGYIPVSASIGIAALGVHGDTVEQLLAAADAAVFAAKQAGRDVAITAVPAAAA